MTITAVEKTWSNRSADKTHAVEVYNVLTTGAADDTAASARDADGLPFYGQCFDGDPVLRCVNRQAAAAGRTLFRVTCQFEKDVLAARQEAAAGDPKGWIVAYGTQSYSEPIDQDIYGEPIANSAGETLDPPVTRTFHCTRITATRDYADTQGRPDERQCDALLDHVNDNPFLQRRTGSVLFSDYSLEPYVGPNGKLWHKLRLEFLHRLVDDPLEEGIALDWQERRLDAGFRRKRSPGYGDADATGFAAITDVNGTPTGRPVPINASGLPLSEGEKPHWLKFDVYPNGDFSVFGIPDQDLLMDVVAIDS